MNAEPKKRDDLNELELQIAELPAEADGREPPASGMMKSTRSAHYCKPIAINLDEDDEPRNPDRDFKGEDASPLPRGMADIIKAEQNYHDLTGMDSLALLEAEDKMAKQMLAKGKLHPDYMAYLSSRVSQIDKQKAGIMSRLVSKELNANLYLEKLKMLLSRHKDILLKEAEDNNENYHLKRIKERIDLLEEEIGKVDRGGNGYFVKFVPSGGTPVTSPTAALSPPSLSSDDSSKILAERIQQYKRLIIHLVSLPDSRRKAEIENKYVPLMQKAGALRSSSNTGEIDTFLKTEFVALKPEDVYGGSMQDREIEIKSILTALEDELHFEKGHLEILMQKTGDGVHDERKSTQTRINELEDQVKEVQKLRQNPWTPLPDFDMISSVMAKPSKPNVDETVDFNKMKITFKRFLEAPGSSYTIQYSIDLVSTVYAKNVVLQHSPGQPWNHEDTIDLRDPAYPIFHELHNRTLNFYLSTGGGCCTTVRVVPGAIPLKRLQWQPQINDTLILSNGMKLEYCIRVREPTARHEIKYCATQLKFYEPFLFGPVSDLKLNTGAFVTPTTSPDAKKPGINITGVAAEIGQQGR